MQSSRRMVFPDALLKFRGHSACKAPGLSSVGAFASWSRCYGAVQPVKAKFSVGSVVAFTVLPELTVTFLLVIEVGEQVNSPFEPSASALME